MSAFLYTEKTTTQHFINSLRRVKQPKYFYGSWRFRDNLIKLKNMCNLLFQPRTCKNLFYQ